MKKLILSLAAAALLQAPALARDFVVGSLTIQKPWARETVAGQMAGGGFLTIVNGGNAGDRLIGATSPAGDVQIHAMTMDGGIMRMRAVDGGLAIPAAGKVDLRPGGYHLMFMGLKAPLRQGQAVPVELRFERAGTVRVLFTVQPMQGGQGGHAGHAGHAGH